MRYYPNQPGLSDLTEVEVEHLVELAKGRREDALWVIPLLWTVPFFVICMAPVAMLVLALEKAPNSTGQAGQEWRIGGVVICAVAVCMVLAASAYVWVWIRRRLIMRSIRLLLSRASCPFCDFDLRGLRVVDGALVRCPECGEVVMLREHGMSRRDLSLEETVAPLPVSPLWHLPDPPPAKNAAATRAESSESKVRP